jgi:hypothetical protein
MVNCRMLSSRAAPNADRRSETARPAPPGADQQLL